jgi:tetratricopeptide (TPR) repeat protein
LLLALIASAAAQAQQSPCDATLSASLQKQAHDALKSRQFDAAAQKFKSAIEACPSDRVILLDLAHAQANARHFDEAVAAANRFLAADPDSIPGKLALANIYFMAQRFEDARNETAQVLAIEQFQPGALKMKANIAYLVGDFGEAESTFIRLLDKYPNDEEGAYMLGRVYYQEGRVPQAMGQFERVIRINPNAYKAYDNLGLCYQALGDEKKAIHAFLTAIKLVETEQAEYDWPYANLASLLLDSGDAKAAFALASKAADRNPLSARNFYIGGKALWQLNKTDLCLNWLERSVALDPNYPEPLYLLARVYQKIGQDEKAQQAREKFRELKAKQPEKGR